MELATAEKIGLSLNTLNDEMINNNTFYFYYYFFKSQAGL